MSKAETLSDWAISSDWTISKAYDNVVTGAADEESLAIPLGERVAHRDGWQKIIDHELIEWGRNPSLLEDEDILPPSGAIIDRAAKLAMCLRDIGWPPPNRVIPNGDGGVVFERWAGSLFAKIDVCPDGSVVFTLFKNARLVGTERLV